MSDAAKKFAAAPKHSKAPKAPYEKEDQPKLDETKVGRVRKLDMCSCACCACVCARVLVCA